MQHFDIASVRAETLTADEALRRLSDAIDRIAIPEGELFPIALTVETLPIEDFQVDVEEDLLAMSRPERHRRFKASTKARTICRKQARAAKRSTHFA